MTKPFNETIEFAQDQLAIFFARKSGREPQEIRALPKKRRRSQGKQLVRSQAAKARLRKVRARPRS